MYIYIYIYIHICIYIYIHIYIYTDRIHGDHRAEGLIARERTKLAFYAYICVYIYTHIHMYLCTCSASSNEPVEQKADTAGKSAKLASENMYAHIYVSIYKQLCIYVHVDQVWGGYD